MSKELEYEINNFANLLHKDCMNLMECLKKQSEDNKPILYLGKHYEKVILPLEEYQKMCNRLESIDNSSPSEALECLEQFINEMTRCLENPKEYVKGYEKQIFWKYKNTLETTIKQALLKAQEQEKENELLKEIIKSLFDRGCPLHQYIDKDFGLTIEVDSECSIMHLGKFKDIDLDKYLKEVLEDEEVK